MSAIGPGDYVECVDASPPAPDTWAADCGAYLVGGRMYRVVSVGRSWSRKYGLGDGVVLDAPETQYDCPDGIPSWPVERFRPIYRRKSDLIETLKQPLPDAVRELEDA
jgi:hypothetical protein